MEELSGHTREREGEREYWMEKKKKEEGDKIIKKIKGIKREREREKRKRKERKEKQQIGTS